jgi:hypothetical protein
MKAAIPSSDEISRILEGIVVDLKKIPPAFLKQVQVHYDDGEIVDLPAEDLDGVIQESEDEGTVAAVEVDLDLDGIAQVVDEARLRAAQIIRDAATPPADG